MNFTEFRLKLRHFVRKYQKLILIIVIIWLIIFFINLMIGNRVNQPTATTTYEPHTAIIDTGGSTPSSMEEPIEELIAEYVGYCNEGNYQKAFNMLSEDCREKGFDNDVDKFMKHVLIKMPTPKEYSIQNYSNIEYGNTRLYIYEIQYTDNLLATGLTNSTYTYTSEKLTFYDTDTGLQMSAGDFIYYENINAMTENEYLKIDVVSKVVNYSIETYEVLITNRSNYTVVIADGVESEETVLVLPNEIRNRSETSDIVLEPQEAKTITMTFPKFVDDGDTSDALLFSSIRVMEKYSGTSEDVAEETIQSEIDNAISKFSMTVSVKD